MLRVGAKVALLANDRNVILEIRFVPDVHSDIALTLKAAHAVTTGIKDCELVIFGSVNPDGEVIAGVGLCEFDGSPNWIFVIVDVSDNDSRFGWHIVSVNNDSDGVRFNYRNEQNVVSWAL